LQDSDASGGSDFFAAPKTKKTKKTIASDSDSDEPMEIEAPKKRQNKPAVSEVRFNQSNCD
jgi:hypothetical protein